MRLENDLNDNIELVDMLGHELIDKIWTEDRPVRPNNPIYEHTMDFAGFTQCFDPQFIASVTQENHCFN